MIPGNDPSTAVFSLKAMAALTRVRLSLVVASFALAGLFSVRHSLSTGVLFTFSGVALLSAAASALNQIQEKNLDALMERTRNRPLQLRSFTIPQAFLAAFILGCSGFVLLFFGTTHVAALVGIFTLVWYNAVYTPIKRKTLFALPVGAMTGALAPVIGCAAAAGKVVGPAIGIACFLFFWQVPHFLLMLLKYGPEYENAGFPYKMILKNEGRFRGIVFLWCAAASVSTLLFPLFGLVLDSGLIAALVLLNILFVLYFYFKVLRRTKTLNFNPAFRSLYFFQGSILVLLIVQGLFPNL